MGEPESGKLKGASDAELPENLGACKDGHCSGSFDGDCVQSLIGLARTDFEKACTSELIGLERCLEKSLAKIETKLKYLEYMITGAFSVVIITYILTRLFG
ncbi:MAG: hypothetical protein ACPLKS_06115 [Caldisericum exile]|uniref:hypothetical protein n=1 Tax=Caldisericum exile TaxID=693075 RepID=UPI003C748BA1